VTANKPALAPPQTQCPAAFTDGLMAFVLCEG